MTTAAKDILDLDKAIDVLLREANLHRQRAETYSCNDAIYSASMSAGYVCSSLVAVLLEARLKVPA